MASHDNTAGWRWSQQSGTYISNAISTVIDKATKATSPELKLPTEVFQAMERIRVNHAEKTSEWRYDPMDRIHSVREEGM